jgi:hypothetical protein
MSFRHRARRGGCAQGPTRPSSDARSERGANRKSPHAHPIDSPSRLHHSRPYRRPKLPDTPAVALRRPQHRKTPDVPATLRTSIGNLHWAPPLAPQMGTPQVASLSMALPAVIAGNMGDDLAALWALIGSSGVLATMGMAARELFLPLVDRLLSHLLPERHRRSVCFFCHEFPAYSGLTAQGGRRQLG